MTVSLDELQACVRSVARGCKGCLRRSGSACSVCDRLQCRILADRMDEAAPIRPKALPWADTPKGPEPAPAPAKRRGRPPGRGDPVCANAVRKHGISAYPDGMPCKTCEHCTPTGGCVVHLQKSRDCKIYKTWRASFGRQEV